MTIPCEQYFTALNYTSSSYANENFITDECISNLAKFILFMTYFTLLFISLLWTLTTIFFEVKRVGWKWDLRKQCYILAAAAMASEIISFFFYFFSIQLSIRYFIYATDPQLTFIAVTLLIRARFKSSIEITFNTDNKFQKLFYNHLVIINIFMAILTISSCIIGPMIAFTRQNWYQVNWFYAVRTSGYGIVSVSSLILSLYTCKKLIQACDQSSMVTVNTNQNVNIILMKLRIIIKLCYLCLPSQIFILTPVWMIWNLYGIFWFHFTVNEFNLVLILIVLVWSLKIDSESSKSTFNSSSLYSHSHSHSQP